VDDDRDWTVGEAGIRYARYPTTELVGTPDAVADQLEEWVDTGADGFVVMPPFVPASLTSVSEHLVPELRQRGLLEAGPTDGTLRERLFDRDARPPTDRPARQ
jgi:Coenzyme F420-dependent N5,N10-methylene tetrahydromethanopterin reductase and related flavin-dependent oxidoreductases